VHDHDLCVVSFTSHKRDCESEKRRTKKKSEYQYAIGLLKPEQRPHVKACVMSAE
jgi:hypothetical protein